MADIQEMKEQAIAYYQGNKVPLRMQDVLNTMFRVNPQDVNGFVSTYFEELALAPTITKAIAMKSMDSKGQPCVTVKVFCLVRNKEVMLGESHMAVDTILLDNARVEEKEAEDQMRDQEVDDAVAIINNDFRDILESANPCHQVELDEKLYQLLESRRLELKQKDEAAQEAEATTPQPVLDDKKGGKKSAKGSAGKKKASQVAVIPDKIKDKNHPGSTALSAISQALSCVGASVGKSTVYDHLIHCFGGDDYSIKLPLPLIMLLQSGKAALGKNNCIKEYMITPRPDMPMLEAISAATKIHESILKAVYNKGGVSAKNLSDSGAVCPVYDKPEQGLDAIADAVSSCGFEMGKDFFFVLDSSAQECFDYEKGKYEVITGMQKGSDDMADFWADISNRYPSIVGLIDPIRCEETQQWNKICSLVSGRCLVIADKAYNRPGLLKDETLDFHEFATSGVVMRPDAANTITHIVECSKKMSDLNNSIIIADGQHTTNDTTIIDVAIASQARFVKLGAPVRGERIVKYNRLVELDGELGERRGQWPSLTFPSIPPKAPTPIPTPEKVHPSDENSPTQE